MVSWLCERGNYRRFTHNVLLRSRPTSTAHPLPRCAVTPRWARHSAVDPDRHSGTAPEMTNCARRSVNRRERSTLTRTRWCGRCDYRMPRELLLAAHHLTVDMVSWHVMLGDVTETWQAMNFGLAPKNAAG